MAEDKLPRRDFLLGASMAGAGIAALAGGMAAVPTDAKAAAAAPANAPADEPETWLILTPQEVAFFSAIADTVIPKDELSPSGTECGIPVFVDRQLAGAWGGGDRMYKAGPHMKGTPEQGYQLPLTPHQFFVAGVRAANAWCEKTYGKTFDLLDAPKREEALTAMQKGTARFEDFDSKQFFGALLTINMEGFFSDPIYGGNRNKASWRMLGFPGLPATYAENVEEYRDKKFVVAEPLSIADFS